MSELTQRLTPGVQDAVRALQNFMKDERSESIEHLALAVLIDELVVELGGEAVVVREILYRRDNEARDITFRAKRRS